MLYNRKYFPLHEVVKLIADRLALADPQNYADNVAAIDGAKLQLLDALFEGTVRAEGVRVYPTEPPTYEPPSVEYDEWSAIHRAVWSHERCEKQQHSYRLEAISVYWDDDYIDFFNSDGEWAEYVDTKIRLVRGDIDREFPAPEAAMQANAPSNEPLPFIYRTGVAGRPTSRDLVKPEMQRRAEEGKLSSTLAAEVRALLDWLQREHPDAPRLSQSAAQNALRDHYRELRAACSRIPCRLG